MSIEADLDEICGKLHKADIAKKRADKEREAARARFFELATAYIADNWTLASEQVNVESFAFDDVTPQTWVERNHPGFRIVSMELYDDGSGDLVIEQDPALQKFEWRHEELGLVFARQVAQVGASFDAERFYTDCQLEGVDELTKIVRQRTIYELDQDATDAYLKDHPEAMILLQHYAHPGKLQVKLGAPRKAKDEV